jgi:ATP-dependent exoDNAse (exonuclease V) alpha subunit
VTYSNNPKRDFRERRFYPRRGGQMSNTQDHVHSADLNAGQAAVVKHVLAGENVNINGSAGTGKSYIIEHLTTELGRRGRMVRVLAPTGVAALNVCGQTLHRFLGISPAVRDISDYMKIWKRSKVPWQQLSVLIIDEVSMIPPPLFSLFDEICRLHTKKNRPFGGIQMVLLGDFFQLPPVRERNAPSDVPRYIFQTAVWKEMNVKVHVLTQVMRQKESDFIAALNDLRMGKFTERLRSLLIRCSENQKEDGKHYVKLFSLNVHKDEANTLALKNLPGQEHTFKAHDVGDERYLKGCRAEKLLTVKVGCPVMMLWNLPDQGLCNGSVGIVEGYDDDQGGFPVVRFNCGVTTTVKQQTWTVQEKLAHGQLRTLASRTQLPLAVAWSVTSHKVQGLTLSHVEADLRGVFDPGQMYVMLSRASTSDGLIVRGFHPRAIMVDPVVREFYSIQQTGC